MAFDEDDPLAETAAFSVVTLRNLVARTARQDVEPQPSSSGPPRILSKGSAILVFPEASPPAIAPSPAAVAPAPSYSPPPQSRPKARVRQIPTAVPRRRSFRRLLSLALLTLAVSAQPWWWNVGDVRAHAGSTSRAARVGR